MYLPAWCTPLPRPGPQVSAPGSQSQVPPSRVRPGLLRWNPPLCFSPDEEPPLPVPPILSGDYLLQEACLAYLHHGVLF